MAEPEKVTSRSIRVLSILRNNGFCSFWIWGEWESPCRSLVQLSSQDFRGIWYVEREWRGEEKGRKEGGRVDYERRRAAPAEHYYPIPAECTRWRVVRVKMRTKYSSCASAGKWGWMEGDILATCDDRPRPVICHFHRLLENIPSNAFANIVTTSQPLNPRWRGPISSLRLAPGCNGTVNFKSEARCQEKLRGKVAEGNRWHISVFSSMTFL